MPASPQHADQQLVKDIDLSAHQVLEELQLVGEQLRRTRCQAGNQGWVSLALFQMLKGSIIQHIALITAAQQR